MNNIIVFGGDGFCGWPTSLGLSQAGYDVTIVDNLVRRKIDIELECESLTPIAPISTRLQAWKELTDKTINYECFDVSIHYHRLLTLFEKLKPVAVVHFAEQRAAPYSMKSPFHKRYTVNNNINATNNILCAIVDSGIDCHVVHLGTMGVYGYGTAGMKIPEGYLKVPVGKGEAAQKIKMLYPANPGSIYHMTKCQDAVMFYYYNKNDNVRITDLHQGIVWGTNTPDTMMDERLVNRFDYDGDYGTVLNRFLMQAVIKHPLTVYGTGGQTRAFIHIRDTVKCVRLAIENPPKYKRRVRIFNQASESYNIKQLAEIVHKLTGAEIRYYKNPRAEDIENTLKFANEGFKSLGWKPIKLNEQLMEEVGEVALKYGGRVDKQKIIATSMWNKDKEPDYVGSEKEVNDIK
jgi:UDP-sulfoquinovose synthase